MLTFLSHFFSTVHQFLRNHFVLSFVFLSPLMAWIQLKIIEISKYYELETLQVLCFSFLLIFIPTIYFMSKPRSIYLVDYTLFKPLPTCRVPFSTFVEHQKLVYQSEPKCVDFMLRILTRSGLGEETSLPPAAHYVPPMPNLPDARAEAQLVIFTIIDALLAKTGISPEDINVLVVNCNGFCPRPSLSAMVVNKYKMRSDIQSFNLAGMGCSAGLIAVDIARDLLRVKPNSYALVVSTETITMGVYTGTQRSMMVSNCLFRMGGAAVLISNKRSDRNRAKYRLLHLVRTNMSGDDKSYLSVMEEEDRNGKVGISLSKDLMYVAGDALKRNITTLAPIVLPISEKLRYLFNLLGRKLFKKKWKPYVPDFKRAFEHMCIHAGGRGVIDEVEKNLRLMPQHVEASRMALYRFGNTSSSSLWYELNYIENKGRMKKGDRVWQIGFGSGFKCNSAVWKCNRTIDLPMDGPWSDTIHKYPVRIPEEINM
ncbi:3-ketoacyl-CoA synthase 6-like [Tasmannia lanceolata]|uniref:3-ketoacyl-CoA synthase 6-like n=1 Tax=Tasmannia lanceolata TaxID=3420 RepID=UPI004064585B